MHNLAGGLFILEQRGSRSMRTLARTCYVHRRLVLLGWIVAIVGVTALHGAVGSSYRDNFKLPHTQSFDAIRLLQRNAPKASGDTDQLVIGARQGKVTDPAIRAKAQALLAQVAELPHVSSVASPYGPTGKAQISPNGDVAFANVTFDAQSNKISNSEAKGVRRQDHVRLQRLRPVPGRRPGGAEREPGQRLERPAVRVPGRGGGPVHRVRSLLATALPLLTAGVSLGGGIGVGRPALARDRHGLVLNELALLIGLGVGIDYALFIVTRYRQGILRGLSGEQAVVESLDTSGRAVLFAGIIVCIAMLGMFALGRQLPVRRRGGGRDRGVIHRDRGADAAAGAAGLLRALVLRRRERRALREGKLRTSDESAALGALDGLDAEASRRVRRRRRRC